MVITTKYVINMITKAIKKIDSRFLSRKFIFLQKPIGIKKAYGSKMFCFNCINQRRSASKICSASSRRRNRTSTPWFLDVPRL